MRKNISRLFLLLSISLALFWGNSASAVKEYYSLSRSIRALGMGGAFYGLSNDENALFYNPAGLAFYEKGKDLMAAFKVDGTPNIAGALSTLVRPGSRTIAEVVSDMESFQGDPLYANVAPILGYYLRKHFAAGLLVADTKVDFSLLGKDLDTTIDVTALSDSGLFLGTGFKVAEGLAVGLNFKTVFRVGGSRRFSVTDIASGTGVRGSISAWGGSGLGIDFDLGAMYQLPEVIPGVLTRVSISLNNVLASTLDLAKIQLANDSAATAPPGLPRMVSFAGHMRLPGFWGADQIDLLLDLAEFGLGGISDPHLGARTGSFWKHLNLGVEVPVAGWAFGRMGFRQGNFTIGAGIDARYFQIDIATYAEELASLPGRLTSRRVALRLAAGFGGALPAVESATKTTVPTPEVAEPKVN